MKAQALLRQATGLNLSKASAERAVRQRMELRAIADSDNYLAGLGADELAELVELVVVPESWLFRDPQAFHAATAFVQQRLAGAGAGAGVRPVRILSLPCAGGEEPYSMAMALRDAGVPAAAYSIDAIDLSAACIARARRGVYGRNAFRGGDTAFRERHFSHLGAGEYRIDDGLRAQVNFRQGNLLRLGEAVTAGYYGVVFCRNLLIYFDKATTKAAIATLAALLADDGILLAGYAEVPAYCQHGFASMAYKQAFALRKKSAEPAAAPPAAPRRARPAPAAAWPAFTPAPRTPPAALAKPALALAPAKLAPLPAGPGNLLEQARSLADRGLAQQAGELCHAHLARQPDAAEAYFILGILNEQSDKMALAEDYWRRCVYLQPDHYEALCHLALLAEHNGNGAAAAAFKARAARIYQRRQAS
ncbi:CheR family methyltransferase [Janthinobacterium sp. CG_S6]|uniref:CheR family methyltransferase n=1 Tax=Janthinobacterium sp. CG_S6 TaxID=3071707 RepID=UPI002DFDBECB|nr:chemotaxis protein methyltransferase WspC [Janthinobacterium sp. CG_S6]